jgi:hypothetical protein
MQTAFRALVYIALIIMQVACGGGGGGGSTPTPTTIAVGGSITGLLGSGLVLQNNGSSDVTIPQGGTGLSFAGISTGTSYSVTIKTQPTSPSQTCTITNSTGVAKDAVNDIAVTCKTNSFGIAGTITGLTGSGLTLLLNGASVQTIGAGTASFSYPAMLSGVTYSVTVGTQPSGQTCSVNGASGTVADKVVTVSVTCGAPGFTIGGTVIGLSRDGLTMSLNGGAPLAFSGTSGTTFTFPNVLQTGDEYGVTIVTLPKGPLVSCALGSNGQVGNANISSLIVRCFANGNLDSYTGTYVVNINGRRSYLTLWFDGLFSLANRVDDPSCTNNGNGAEFGVYKRATNGTFSIHYAVTDTTGVCGLWFVTGVAAPTPGSGFEGTMVRSGNTLTLTSGTTVLTALAVESVPTTLVGAFTRADGVDGSFVVFESDGTYVYQVAQQGGGTSSNPAGFERGCYVVNGATFTTSLAASCTPNGLPALDLNGTNGFSRKNGAPIPFTVPSATTLTIDGVLYNRILPAG